jgi:hypothetical protein
VLSHSAGTAGPRSSDGRGFVRCINTVSEPYTSVSNMTFCCRSVVWMMSCHAITLRKSLGHVTCCHIVCCRELPCSTNVLCGIPELEAVFPPPPTLGTHCQTTRCHTPGWPIQIFSAVKFLSILQRYVAIYLFIGNTLALGTVLLKYFAT